MAELENMPTISEIAAWCDFEECDDLARLLTLLGAKPTTKTRIFSAIPQELLESTNQKWRLPTGESPNPILQTKAVMLEAVARITHRRRADRQKTIELEELKTRANLTTASAGPPAKMIKLSSLVGDDREVRPMQQAVDILWEILLLMGLVLAA